MRPITPQPGYVEQDLHDLLATKQFIFAECFTIIPLAGSPLLYTSAQQDTTVVPVGGGPGRVTYKAKEVLITGLRYQTGIGVEVDQQSVDISYGDGLLWQAALTFSQALRLGRMDGATIQRDRFFAPEWAGQYTEWIAGVPMFTGLSSTLDKVGSISAKINVKSSLVLLDVEMPRDLWQPQCKHTWGDVGCGLNQGTFVVQTTVPAGSTRTTILFPAATIEFAMGKVHIEGQDNVTRVRTILSVVAGVSVDVIYPLDFDPQTGQDVAFYPNCRREYARCGLYHIDPEQSFLGFPFVPVVETAA